MRHTAAHVYNLDAPARDKLVLQHWSAHSIRVGACVILHAMGCSESQNRGSCDGALTRSWSTYGTLRFCPACITKNSMKRQQCRISSETRIAYYGNCIFAQSVTRIYADGNTLRSGVCTHGTRPTGRPEFISGYRYIHNFLP
jgi:hypothetical protein